MKSICIDILNNFEIIAYVGIIDENTKLLVGKWNNVSGGLIETTQSQVLDAYEIYSILRNLNNRLDYIKSHDFRFYIIITKNRFKLIVIPLSDDRIKYICIFIISNKSIKNLAQKVVEFVNSQFRSHFPCNCCLNND